MRALKKDIQQSFRGKSKIPYITVNKRLGKVFFNKKSIDMVGLTKGDMVSFDAGKSNVIYVRKTKDQDVGFTLYKYGGRNNCLSFANKNIIDKLIELANLDNPHSDLIRMRLSATAKNGIFMLSVLTAE